MATLSNTARSAACDAIVDTLNGGFFVCHSAAHAEVSTNVFGNPAFGAAVNGVATANAIADDTSATGGTVAHAHITKSDTTVMLDLTCGVAGSGADVIFGSLSVGAGDTVSVTSMTITIQAS